ncbi:OmpA family protein [Winogradskyella sp. 4-2091]|uniref:OmpA family protein n=1 Tax=Winogradskyella sp. 4-2091 TaxID=3381659 RepID=UPI0038915F4F
MRKSFILKQITLTSIIICFVAPNLEAQTKKLKRPKSKVGINSVDRFVKESFDLYDKVYKYDAYAATGTPLEDEDLDVLEDAIEEITVLSESAPDILSDLDGKGAVKQAKATLQINRAKKALKYSIKTAKELLLGQRQSQEEEEEEEEETAPQTDSNKEPKQQPQETQENEEIENLNVSDQLEIYSKYDFVPGDQVLFFDDFSQDFVGDFPSKWNTNGSGEVIRTNKAKGNWFEMIHGNSIFYIPDVNQLPEDYTIEFDVLTSGLSKHTSMFAALTVVISDSDNFVNGKEHYAKISIPIVQNSNGKINCHNYFNRSGGDINSYIKADISKEVLNQPHIAISVTKKRLRLWVNETKHVDIPRFIEELNVLNYLKFSVSSLKDVEHVFIKNLKVAEGGVDLRRKLLSEGKISTNGILFDSGSSNIQPQSLGIVRQISQVLMQDETIKLKIIGHTDADGPDDTNLKLSKDRAHAVKDALVSIYKISSERLTTDGKGETQPVDDNNTADGKAQNRRVEFIKI